MGKRLFHVTYEWNEENQRDKTSTYNLVKKFMTMPKAYFHH